VRAIAGTAIAGLALTGLVATGAGAQAGTDPGVSAKAVKLGYIFSETGAAGSTFKNAGKACQARIGRANAQGGVNGRKIQLEVIDDTSSGANLTAAQDLVQNRNVFAVVNNSSFAFLAYRYLLGAGVPMVGGGYDGTYYGLKGNETMLSALGNAAPFNGLGYDNVTKVMKQLGATKSAAVAYGASPSATASAKTTQDYAAPAAGIKGIYTNSAVDFGSTDVGPIVLGIKNSGADALYLPLVAATDFAILQGLQQNGVKLKAILMPTGYGQDLLDSSTASIMGPNTVLFQTYKPVEIGDKATKQFQADLKKYGGFTGVPDYGVYTGYISCDLAVTALQQAGQTPTRKGFVDGFRKLGTWDQAGLACQPVNVGLDTYGKYPPKGCIYTVTLKNGKYVVGNKGKPVFGKLVGSPEALKANATGNPDLVTTTTAAPAP
jgi:branched-chain amino acid transport system substrate-binding protein